ncbi:MAG: CDP-alcohol phosphatidyltransferase [Phototrophicales bacterium]|nr:MAG: CDP-alcohol phosphatidyltransferase [Phototrophicales bacterium]
MLGSCMFDKSLREIKERVFTPIAQTTGKVLHPTTLSVIGLLFGIGAGCAAWDECYALGCLLWGINRLIDGLDGTVARLHNKQTDFGGYVDILLDFIVYAWIPLGFAFGDGSADALLATACLISVFYVNAASWSVLAAILEKRNAVKTPQQTSIVMPPGIIEGAETVIFYMAFFLFPQKLIWLFGILSSLVLLTVLQRLIWARRNL